jgi:hypothetical protein
VLIDEQLQTLYFVFNRRAGDNRRPARSGNTARATASRLGAAGRPGIATTRQRHKLGEICRSLANQTLLEGVAIKVVGLAELGRLGSLYRLGRFGLAQNDECGNESGNDECEGQCAAHRSTP